MKTNHIRLSGSLGLLMLPLTCGSQFAIDWHSINGGGGTSTGGVFAISGTIGHPDAGMMNGEGFSIVGGFWSIEAVQMPGTPLLTIRRTQANTVVVSWPSPSTGFSLQQVEGLNLSNWASPAEAISDNGTNRFITVQPPAGNRFYRLFKP